MGRSGKVVGRWVARGGAVPLLVLALAGHARAQQTIGNITSGLEAELEGDDGSIEGDYVGIVRDTAGPERQASVNEGCLPATPTNARLLQFALYTQNDGYSDIVLNFPAPPPAPNLQPDLFVWHNGLWNLNNFSKFALVRAEPRNPGVVQSRAAVAFGEKHHYSLTNNDFMVYRGDIGPCSPSIFQKPWGNAIMCQPTHTTFVPGATMGLSPGSADDYGLPHPCQHIQLDGITIPGDPNHTSVPDGIYDLVVEQNRARVVPEGRAYDNVTVLRIKIAGETVKLLRGSTPQANLPLPGADPKPFVPGAYGAPWFDSSSEIAGAVTGGSSPPSVVSRDINQYDLFYVGADGALYRKWQDTIGNWLPAYPLPGAVISDANQMSLFGLTGAPAAIAADRSRIDVFARSTTGEIFAYVATSPDSPPPFIWPITDYGAQAATSPVAVASSPTSMMVVWLNTSGAVVYGTSNGTTWQPPVALAGGTFPTDQAPALAASGNGVYHLFVRGANGAASYNRFVGGQWTGWRDIGGSALGSLGAASPYQNRVDVFERTPANKLARNTLTWKAGTEAFLPAWVDNETVGDDGSLPADIVGSSPTVISTGPMQLDVFYYDTRWGGAMAWTRHWDGTAAPLPAKNWLTYNLGRVTSVLPGSPIVASSWGDHTLDIFQTWQTGLIQVRSMR